jgi:mannose-6-phosphate isomerase-like protein (cupin superfamily)
MTATTPGPAPAQLHTRHRRSAETFAFLGAHFTYLAEARHTAGAYGLMETTTWRGQEPGPHVHRHEDEAYYVLEGAWTFHCAGTDTDAEPGSFVVLPRNLPHHFTLRGEVGRALIIVSPAGLEACFRESSTPLGEGVEPPDLTRVVAAFTRRGIELLPAPPGVTPPGR